MADEDDFRDVELAGELGHVVGGTFEGVVGEVLWCLGLAVADHVWCNDAVVEGEEVGDLTAPAERDVGPTVN